MKRLLLCILLTTNLISSTDYTPPIGVTSIDITAGTSSSSSFTFLSIGYNREPVYAGMVDSINGTSLTLAGFSDAGFEDNVLAQGIYLLRITDGDSSGTVFHIISHVSDIVTINATSDQISAHFTQYQDVEIIKANTLESVFGIGDDFIGLSGRPGRGDKIYVWNSVGWKFYFHYNGKWYTTGTRTDQKDTIIYPDEGLVYERKSTAITLNLSGNIPTSVQCYVPPADYNFLMGNPFPVDKTLSQLIDTDTNWSSSTTITSADQVLIWTGSIWTIYYHDGSNWINLMAGSIDDRVIPSGTSFMILRSNNSDLYESYNKVNLSD